MKNLFVIVVSILMIAACNLKEGLKETGDALNQAFGNISEGVKDGPKAVGDAGNKAAKAGEEAVKD